MRKMTQHFGRDGEHSKYKIVQSAVFVIICFASHTGFGQGGDSSTAIEPVKPGATNPRDRDKSSIPASIVGRWEAVSDDQITRGSPVRKINFEHNQLVREFFADGRWRTESLTRGNRMVMSGILVFTGKTKFKLTLKDIKGADFEPKLITGQIAICDYNFPNPGKMQLNCKSLNKHGAVEVTDNMLLTNVSE